MRSDEEDDEEEFEEDNEDDEELGLDSQANGMGGGDDDVEEGFDEDDGSGEDDDEDQRDDEDDEDEDEDGDGDGEGEGDGDGEEDEDEDEEEEDDGQSDEDAEDVDVNGDDDLSSHPSQISPKHTPVKLPQPPHLIRRSLFIPHCPSTSPSIEAIVAIPLPSPIYSIASTTCSSYLLTGTLDGYVRAYDFWASVNGSQLMTAQQRTVVGLGEGVSKAGVGRGWWTNEVEGLRDGMLGKRMEPVYSMAVEGDGLFALTGTQSGPINLYTLRHSPGHLVHSLKGHSSVVSCMALLPNEKGLLSGSWDGSVREWDLNTGQVVRKYPSHGAQISSLSLRPFSHPPSPTPSPTPARIGDENERANRRDVFVSVGPDFYDRRQGSAEPKDNGDGFMGNGVTRTQQADAIASGNVHGDKGINSQGQVNPAESQGDGDVEMEDKASSYDPLFDDDAEREDALASSANATNAMGTPAINDMAPPTPKTRPPSLALPGMSNSQTQTTTNLVIPANSTSLAGVSEPTTAATPLFSIPPTTHAGPSRSGAASNIPLLTKTDFKTISDDVLMTSSMDGQVVLIDRRVPHNPGGNGVGRLSPGDKAPPWCMSACWSGNGNQVLAGRRNGTIDIWDVRSGSTSSSPNLLRTLRTPTESGAVSCVVALHDGQHVATASQDNLRLWNTAEYFQPEESMALTKKSKSRPSFKIVAGHHGGTVSSMIVDPTCRFLITASGDRGWQGESTKMVLVHEIKWQG